MKSKCICKNCKHYNSDECYCEARGEHEIYPEDSCEEWEEEIELTKEEEDEIIGDREYHRKVVED